MEESKNHGSANGKKSVFIILSGLLVLGIAFSIITIVFGVTPNPGHPWSEVGDGIWQATGTTAMRTFTFPDLDAKVLTSSSSIIFLQRTITTSVTLSAATDTIVYANPSAPITITLPSATTSPGIIYIIKKIDAGLTNIVTVSGAQTIDGLTSISLANRGESVMLQSDGTIWRIAMRRDYDVPAFITRGSTLNQWYTSPNAGTALATGTLTANKAYALPLVVSKISTIDQMSVNITTLAGTNGRLGLYNDNGNNYPGTLVVDCGTVADSSVGVKTCSTGLPVTLDTGLYWMVFDADGAVTVRSFATASLIPVLGYASTLPTNAQFGWTATLTEGAYPATYPTTGSSTITAVPIPAIFVRFSS